MELKSCYGLTAKRKSPEEPTAVMLEQEVTVKLEVDEDLTDMKVKEDPVSMEVDNDELRMVLVGKTGSGKSASGNTILGRRQFISQASASSVTKVCELGSVEIAVDGEIEDNNHAACHKKKRRITVVDIPGFGDTHLTLEETQAEIAKCVSLSAPGPHAFLLVIPIGRYTGDENQAVGLLARIFGEDAVRHHTMVLFTRGDDLENVGIDEYLKTSPPGLLDLIERCGRRYHVFNNRDPSNSSQTSELLGKVEEMAARTSRSFYTNDMFLEADAAIAAEARRVREQEQEEEEEFSEEEGDRCPKRRKHEQESDREEVADVMAERSNNNTSRARFRGQRPSGNRANSRREVLRSALRTEVALSPKVLERVKIMVASGATGMAVGALFGALVPLAGAAGASLAGRSVGFIASRLAEVSATSVGNAVGAIVATASGKTAVAVGTAAGAVVGGSVGIVGGAEALSPQEGALDTLNQVSLVGSATVGAAAGLGAALGAGAALSTVLGGTTGTAALAAPEAGAVSAAAEGGCLVSAAAPQVAGPVTGAAANGGCLVSAAAPQVAAPAGPAAAAAQQGAVAALGATCEATGAPVALAHNRAGETTSRILTAVTEIGKAAVSALAGSLVVKVVREKVRGSTGTTERSTYEVHLNH